MSKSNDEAASEAIFLDLKNLVFCFVIMYLYTSVMINGSNWSNMRFFLTAIGLCSVLLGIMIANGITSALGYDYMPHFSLFPFLLLFAIFKLISLFYFSV